MNTVNHAFSLDACSFKLFSVNGGLPADQALEAASCYLDVAIRLAVTGNDNNANPWAMRYLAGMAKALVDSISIGKEETQ